jgi:hypothetical protein
MDEEKDERRGFQVRDRRRFSETGEVRDDVPEQASAPAPPPVRGPRDVEAPITFSTFLLGLSTQVLLHLGEIPNPISKKVERDLAAAKEVIDILGILREKTRNNLEADEQTLLDSVLYDLRMRYVELARSAGGEGR